MLFEVSSAHFIKTIQGHWKTEGRTDYRLVINHRKKIIHVTGQHSYQYADWLDNLDFRRRALENKPEQWFSGRPDIMVHAGFLRQYKAVRSKLLDAAYKYPDYSIRVDGFSLGASWPQIFVQDILHRWPKRDIQAILYAPGNPWRRLPRNYRAALERCTTFVTNIYDVVTWMRLVGFKRFGKEVRYGRPWRILPKQHRPEQIIRGLDERKNK